MKEPQGQCLVHVLTSNKQSKQLVKQQDCCMCRMMQATLQAQYEPLALMPAPQQMQRQQQQQQQHAVYQQLALMSPQHMQPAAHVDSPIIQRQLLPWQQQQQLQRQPIRQQLMQLPYTSHTNPAAQQDVYTDDQVSFEVLSFFFRLIW